MKLKRMGVHAPSDSNPDLADPKLMLGAGGTPL